MMNDSGACGVDRQGTERAMNVAQLHELKLGRLDPGGPFEVALVVAIVKLALGTVCHGKLASDIFLGFVRAGVGSVRRSARRSHR